MMGYLFPHPAVPVKLPPIRSLLLDLPEPVAAGPAVTPPEKYVGGTSPVPPFQLPSPRTSPLDTNRLSLLSRVSASNGPYNYHYPEYQGGIPPPMSVLPPLVKNRENLPVQTSVQVAPVGASSSAVPAAVPTSLPVVVVANETKPTIDEPSRHDSRPRKKRQCPQCKLYFSNLATHKSTHLKSTSRPHVCKYCHRGFARPNDLFRHTKCHWKEIGSDRGQFKCPFKTFEKDGSGDEHCCHPLGIFSRCDTFKNHLKAIHFKYPAGTRKDQRSKVPGTCRQCQQEFANVDDWLINHVEKGNCSCQNHD